MAGALTLRVITPEKIALDTTADSVVVPALDGLLGILPRHARLVTALGAGALTYKSGGQETAMFVSGGFAEVRENTVRVVCEAGEPAEKIDLERARAAEQRARERLKLRPDGLDPLRAEAALHRAVMRLRVSGERR